MAALHRYSKALFQRLCGPLIMAVTLLLLYETSIYHSKPGKRSFHNSVAKVTQQQASLAANLTSETLADSSSQTPATWNSGATQLHPPRIILYWTPLYEREDFRLGFEATPFEGCPVSNCWATSNKSLLAKADGVLFHGRSLNDSDLPRFRRPEQKFIFNVQESPIFTYLNWTGFGGFFNLSMTYKRDADIYYPYGETAKGRQEGNPPEFSKRKPAAVFMASHCETHSEREKYVQDLEKYMPVIKLGKCGDRLCNATVVECYRQLASENLFYLAFENSLCEDYITEKFWLSLRFSMIPVVRGPSPETYRAVAPPHSFIHVSNFRGPGALAAYLRSLAQNRTAYEEYHAWREGYRVQEPRVACDLCAELWKSASGSRRLKISDVWSCKKHCHEARDVRVDHIVNRMFILKTKLVHRRRKELEAALYRSKLPS